MNATQLLSIAALTTLAAFSAHAEGGDTSQHGYDFKSTRTVAEVKAEARNPVRISNGSTGVLTMPQSGLDKAAVRAEAASALRAGKISSGEIGLM